MGNSAAAALNEAAALSTGASVPADAPHSGPEALALWNSIDTGRVDLGRFAERVRAAQQRLEAQQVRPFRIIRKAHEKYIRVVVWDPFRDLLISGGGDGWIRLWDTVSYTATGGFDTKMSVRSLLVLREELVSGHGNGDVTVWTMMERSSQSRLQTLKGHKEAVYSLATLSSGELVTGAEDIRVYSRSALDGFRHALTVAEEILCICVVVSTAQVVTGNMNSLVVVWDVSSQAGQRSRTDESWTIAASCQGHTRAVWALCYVSGEDRVVSGSADYTIRVWKPGSWECQCVLQEHTNWVVGLAAAPGCLLSCSNDHTVRAWDTYTWTCTRSYAEQRYEVYGVCAFGAGRFASAGAERRVILYGSAEHAEDLDRSTARAGPSAPAVSREPRAGRQGAEEAGAAQLRTRTPPKVRFDTSSDPTLTTCEHVEAPLRGLMAQAAARNARERAEGDAGYPARQADDSKEDKLKQRRAKLLANKNLDMTMSDFRGQLVTAPDREAGDAADGEERRNHGRNAERSRLPNISEDAVTAGNDEIDCVAETPHWGRSSPSVVAQDRPSINSVSSLGSVASVSSVNSAFQEHDSGNAAPARKANVSPAYIPEIDDMMFDTCKVTEKDVKEWSLPARSR